MDLKRSLVGRFTAIFHYFFLVCLQHTSSSLTKTIEKTPRQSYIPNHAYNFLFAPKNICMRCGNHDVEYCRVL